MKYTNIEVFTTSFFEKIMEIYFITTSYYAQIYFIVTSYMKYGWLWCRILDTDLDHSFSQYDNNLLIFQIPNSPIDVYLVNVYLVWLILTCFLCENKTYMTNRCDFVLPLRYSSLNGNYYIVPVVTLTFFWNVPRWGEDVLTVKLCQ